MGRRDRPISAGAEHQGSASEHAVTMKNLRPKGLPPYFRESLQFDVSLTNGLEATVRS